LQEWSATKPDKQILGQSQPGYNLTLHLLSTGHQLHISFKLHSVQLSIPVQCS